MRHFYYVIVDIWFIILNNFGINHFISIGFTNWGRTDGRTDRPMDGRMDQLTDIASYRDVYLRYFYNVIVDLWFIKLNHFGVNHFISTGFANWLLTDRLTDLPIES